MWNTSTGRCLHKVALEAAIISLSFHPSGRMLAMASSLYVYLWDYNVSDLVLTYHVVILYDALLYAHAQQYLELHMYNRLVYVCSSRYCCVCAAIYATSHII